MSHEFTGSESRGGGGVVERPRLPDYEALRMIGRGAYGDVWLARGRTGILRAVKVVWRERFADAEPFEREFRGVERFAAISLETPGQLGLLHVGRDEAAGFFHYVMELADDVERGRDIDPASYVPLTAKELKARRGRLPARECLALGAGLARALAGLHARGLVHRDVKPSNIVFVQGAPRLADIGLVAASAGAETYVGTEGYVPPEGPGGPAADVFALGRVLYELVTGRDGDAFPRLPEELGEGEEKAAFFRLNAVILRACEREPARRQADGAALLADLEAAAGVVGGGAAGAAGRRGRFRAWGLVGMGLCLGGLAWWAASAGRGGAEEGAVVQAAGEGEAAAVTVKAPTIAVLAFANLSEERGSEYFSDGVSEQLLATLARAPGLRVAGRSSSFYFKGRAVAPAEIARELGVEHLLEGSVRRAGDKVRVTVYLTRVADGFSVWSESYDRDAADILAVQDEIAGLVLARLRPSLAPEAEAWREAAGDVAKAGAGRTEDAGAYRLFLEGRFLLNRRTAKDLPEAVACFRRAVERDPDFALGWANLAYAQGWMFTFKLGGHDDVVVPALEAARRAIRLAPELAEAHAALAGVAVLDWDWKTAREAKSRALELAPRDADVLQTASWVALCAESAEESAALTRRALEVDPFNLGALLNLGFAQSYLGRYAEAEETGARMKRIAPESSFGDCVLWDARLWGGKWKESLAEADTSNYRGARTWTRAYVYFKQGRREEADAELARLREGAWTTSYELAMLHGWRGEADEAFRELEKAVAARDQNLAMVRHSSFLRGLHGDPRWKDVLGKMGLEQAGAD